MPVAELRVPKPLWDLMQFCESFCVSACCHEQAFDLSREQVQRWAELVGEDEFTFARKQLRHFIKKVAYAEGRIECRQLFWLRDKDSLLNWLTEWSKVVNE
jgi:hypothetical protein